MKAVQYSRYGGPEVLEVADVSEPIPKEGQILVEIKASAINPFDWKVRSGIMKDSIPLELPVTICGDFSGEVSKVLEDISEFSPGDEVYGSASVLNGGSGGMAELASVNLKSLSKKPRGIGHEEAAAIVLVGVSTIQALDQLDLSPGKKLMIHGGAGGIGSTAVQYAKHLGAYVAATAKGSDADFVKGLGADEVIDYERQDFTEIIKDFDAVFDTVGGETYTRSYQVLKNGGVILSMNMEPDEQLAKERGIKALVLSSKVNTDSLNSVRELVEQSVIKPQVDKVFPLEQAADAFAYQESGKAKGKVVVQI